MKKFLGLFSLVLIISNPSFASFPVIEKEIDTLDVKCDNIILKDGKEISAKIIEITPEMVKYRKCPNTDGPLISIYKSDILMLRYADGSKDIITLKADEDFSGGPTGAGLGFLSIMLGFMSWFVFGVIFAPASLVLGIISIAVEEKKAPGIIGTIIGGISTLILLLALSF